MYRPTVLGCLKCSYFTWTPQVLMPQVLLPPENTHMDLVVLWVEFVPVSFIIVLIKQ